MKIIVASDSHGNFGIIKRIVEQEEPFDLLIHLGDGVAEGYRLQKIKGFHYDAVNGNNDPKDFFPDQLILTIGKEICLFTHGHQFEIHRDFNQLLKLAKKNKVSFVFFGHTHKSTDKFIKGIRFLNPGSVCSYLNPHPGYFVVETTQKSLKIDRIEI